MAVEDPQALILAGVAILAVLYVVRWQTDPLRSIPTVGGPSAPGLALFTGLKFVRNGRKVMTEGYKKYYGTPFKIAQLDKWLVVVSGQKLVDELWRAPDTKLSTPAAIQDTVQIGYTLGPEIFHDPFETAIIREKLTRALPVLMPDVVDEIKLAVSDYIPCNDEWAPVDGIQTMSRIIGRTSGRIFVGLPLCRDEEFLSMILGFTMDVLKDRFFVTVFPYFLKPYVGPIFSRAKKTIDKGLAILQPMINDRKKNMQELGDDWSDKPMDVLQWIIEEGIARKCSDYKMVERLFLANFAAIHTTSTTLTHALYDLASTPELIPEIREEVESVIASDGWSKEAVSKMWKLDSVCRETLRHHGLSLLGFVRRTVTDVTLSDGTFIPNNTTVAAAAFPTHHDSSVYADPDVLDPLRFTKLGADGDVRGALKHQTTVTSTEFMPFGHGKHACPGRWFAANEVKLILARIVLVYDIKLGGDGKRLAAPTFGSSVLPPRGHVFFRKRQGVSQS
ncbi:hypothetical protein V8D89_010491 [Ganoderma adspersum]